MKTGEEPGRRRGADEQPPCLSKLPRKSRYCSRLSVGTMNDRELLVNRSKTELFASSDAIPVVGTVRALFAAQI
jgi:hypothetical protein